MAYFYLVSGFALLVYSGHLLVKGSVDLARYVRVPMWIIGLTVVAFGTSAPELIVSLKAVLSGSHEIALGNVLGSNVANLGLVIGVVALISPIVITQPSLIFHWGVMFGASLLLFLFFQDGSLSQLEGALCVLLLLVYLFVSVRRKSLPVDEIPLDGDIRPPLFRSLLYVVFSSLGLYFGADWIVSGARDLALGWGVSERVISVSIVAFGTSIPELATSLIALYKRESDISVGNIIGSNIFNILAVLGITALIKPLTVSSFALFANDLWWVLIFSLLLLVFLMPLRRGVLSRWKGGVFLICYICYILVLYI